MTDPGRQDPAGDPQPKSARPPLEDLPQKAPGGDEAVKGGLRGGDDDLDDLEVER
jgi:hypothetical protein